MLFRELFIASYPKIYLETLTDRGRVWCWPYRLSTCPRGQAVKQYLWAWDFWALTSSVTVLRRNWEAGFWVWTSKNCFLTPLSLFVLWKSAHRIKVSHHHTHHLCHHHSSPSFKTPSFLLSLRYSLVRVKQGDREIWNQSPHRGASGRDILYSMYHPTLSSIVFCRVPL